LKESRNWIWNTESWKAMPYFTVTKYQKHVA
jgi:hypothetical protein